MHRENVEDRAGASGRFEENLRMLLSRAYEPPVFSSRFRDDLLSNLKQRQRRLVASRRRRRNIIYLASAATAAAATVVLVLSPMGMWQGHTMPADNTHAILADNHPSATPVTNAQDDPQLAPENTASASAAVVAKTSAAPGGAMTIQALAPMEMRRDGDDAWTSLAKDETVRLAQGDSLRAPKETVEIRMGDGARMALAARGEVMRQGDDLVLMQGDALVDVDASGSAVPMSVDMYRVAVQPGAKAFFQVRDGQQYAAGGAPAPTVAILRGNAFATGPHGSDQLQPDHIYQLDRYVTARIPGRLLGESERNPRIQIRDIEGLGSALKAGGRKSIRFLPRKKPVATPNP